MKTKTKILLSIWAILGVATLSLSFIMPEIFKNNEIVARFVSLIVLGAVLGLIIKHFLLIQRYPQGFTPDKTLRMGQKLSLHSKAFMLSWGGIIFAVYTMAAIPSIFGFINNYAIGFLIPFSYGIVYPLVYKYYDEKMKK